MSKFTTGFMLAMKNIAESCKKAQRITAYSLQRRYTSISDVIHMDYTNALKH